MSRVGRLEEVIREGGRVVVEGVVVPTLVGKHELYGWFIGRVMQECVVETSGLPGDNQSPSFITTAHPPPNVAV